MILSKEHLNTIRPHISKVAVVDDLDILVQSDKREDLYTILDALDDLFVYYLQPDDEPSDLSLMFEKIRDQFYYDNFLH